MATTTQPDTTTTPAREAKAPLSARLNTALDRASKTSLVLLFFAFPVSVALANVLMLCTLLLWLAKLVTEPSVPVLKAAWRNPITLPALAIAAWIALAAAWSPAEWSAILSFFQKYLKFLLLPIFVSLLTHAGTRRKAAIAFALAMLLTLLSTYLNIWFDLPWSRTRNQGWGVDHTVFKDYISQGIMVSLFTCLSAFWALKSKRTTAALAWWTVAALSAASILFLSSGRTGFLALLMSTGIFSLFAFGVSKRKAALALGVTLLGFVLIFNASPQLQQRTQQAWHEASNSSLATLTSIGARIEVTRFALQSAAEKPVFGHGTASFPVLAKTYFGEGAWCSTVCPHPHNQFVFFLFEQGLVGLTLFLWFISRIVKHGLQQEPARRGLVLGFVAIMIANGVTHSSFWLSTESHFMILITALMMGAALKRGKA